MGTYYGMDTSTSDSTSTSTIWVTWTCTSTAGTADTWFRWVTDSTTSAVTVNATPYRDHRSAEQRAADEARWAAERAETKRRADIAAAERKAATAKARRLLLSMLDEQQRQQLERQHFFEVVAKSSRRRYRIHQGTHGNVRLLDDKGREVTRYCGQPNGVPTEDAMLAQKLQIEHDEPEFVRRSNATRLTA